MAESKPAQIRIRDSLSEVTRNERRFLLGISIIRWFPMKGESAIRVAERDFNCFSTGGAAA